MVLKAPFEASTVNFSFGKIVLRAQPGGRNPGRVSANVAR
jgi:hypothetical protein